MPVEWLDPIPAIRFEGGPLPCTIIGTSRVGTELTIYLRIPIVDAYGEVLPHLSRHATGWPSADQLRARIVSGKSRVSAKAPQASGPGGSKFFSCFRR